ncbi:type 1 fimbrial protein [Klebsiella sp. T2.Ur]|nr:type 1 fimbrial protein [Klebsiella sp. T2.Ur]
MEKNIFVKSGLLLLTMLFYAGIADAQPELIGGDVRFHGSVVALPCSIVPGSDNLMVDFKQASVKDLYLNTKTRITPFTIHLENCSTRVFDTVSVTFSGPENSKLPDHLAITPRGQGSASGVGIGLEEMDGVEIKLNHPTTPLRIQANTMDLTYKAYLQGEPDAVNNKTITYGTFTATATFTLNYQ